jgi:hypothetical protein
MRPALKTASKAGFLFLGGLAGFALIARAGGEERAASPSSLDASVVQGDRQSSNAGPSTLPPLLLAQRPAAPSRASSSTTRNRASGGARPGSAASRGRDWSTGRRMTLHKPWMNPR